MDTLKDVLNAVSRVISSFGVLDIQRMIYFCKYEPGIYREIAFNLFLRGNDVDFSPVKVFAGVSLCETFGNGIGLILGYACNGKEDKSKCSKGEAYISSIMNTYLVTHRAALEKLSKSFEKDFEAYAKSGRFDKFAEMGKEIDERENERLSRVPDYERFYYDTFSNIAPLITTQLVQKAWIEAGDETRCRLPATKLPGVDFNIPLEKLHVLQQTAGGFEVAGFRIICDAFFFGADVADFEVLISIPEIREEFKAVVKNFVQENKQPILDFYMLENLQAGVSYA
ncbi:MAG: hypothetical protein GY757_25145 [bacterium]|nr:hypothetical protein [bacterium]